MRSGYRNVIYRVGKRLAIGLVVWTVFLLPLGLQAHLSFYFQQLDMADGLPSSEVYDIHQSSDGYLWIATDHGLCRYDGRKFKVFTTQDGLTDNTIFDIVEHGGRLWFSTYSGGICYLENGRFFAIPENDRLLEQCGPNYVDNMIFDDQGNSWLTLSLSNLNEKTILLYRPDSGLLEVAGKERLQLGDSEESLELDLTRLGWMKERVEEGVILPDYGRNYLEPSSGGTFFAFGNFLYFLSEDRRRFSLLKFPDKIKALYEDRDGDVWVAEARGKGVFHLQGPNWSMSQADGYLKGKSVTDIFQDREGILWFATIEEGVFFLPSKGIRMLHWPAREEPRKILAMEIWRDTLWLGTYEGDLIWIDRQWNHGVETYPIRYSIFALHGHSRDLLLLSNRSWKLDRWQRSLFAKNNVNVKCMVEERGGALWMGGVRGLKKVRINDDFSGVEEQFFRDFKSVHALHLDSEDRLWIGEVSGLYSLAGDSLVYHGAQDTLLRYRITAILERKPGQLILATKGAGLLVWEGGQVRQIDRTAGLNSNFVKDIYLQGDSVLWVGSNMGLNRLVLEPGPDFEVLRIEGFGAGDGLPSVEVNVIASYNDLICLGTGNGFCILDEDFFQNNQPPPVLQFSGFYTARGAHPLSEALFLPAHLRDVRVGFVGLSYRNSRDVKYEYRLEGYDERWHYTFQPEVKYTNLAPGKYCLQVRAAIGNGNWSDTYSEITFEILPHFTQTWWFRLLATLFGFFLLSAVVFFIIRRQQSRAALGRRIIESEQQALRSQINPHFIFNAMNSIQYFITENDKHNASLFLTRFSRLIRRILENSKKNWVSLEEELEGIRSYLALEQMRFGDTFRFDISLGPGVDPYEWEIPSMLIQPFLENSIWHGIMPRKEGGFLAVRFLIRRGYLVCEIEDNGIGRKEAGRIRRHRRHKSMGIANVRERINLLNRLHHADMRMAIADLTDADKQPTGTLVSIRFLKVNTKGKKER